MNIQLIENAYRHFLIEKKGNTIFVSSVADPDGSGTFAWIRIQQNKKEEINKNGISHCRPMNSGLFVL